MKRLFYNYFLRDMSVASLELLVGLAMLVGGVVFGTYHWAAAMTSGRSTPVGTIMLAVLPILIGVQLILAFLAYDFASTPNRPISSDLDWPTLLGARAAQSTPLTSQELAFPALDATRPACVEE